MAFTDSPKPPRMTKVAKYSSSRLPNWWQHCQLSTSKTRAFFSLWVTVWDDPKPGERESVAYKTMLHIDSDTMESAAYFALDNMDADSAGFPGARLERYIVTPKYTLEQKEAGKEAGMETAFNPSSFPHYRDALRCMVALAHKRVAFSFHIERNVR